MVEEAIRLAVIGAGYWGGKLSKEYNELQKTRKDLVLVRIVDASKERLSFLEKELKNKNIKFESDYKKTLSDPKLKAVHIALPNDLHYTVARAALEAGKNVLLEKPMALTSGEAFKLARLADEKGLVLQVGHIFRFNNALRTVRRMIREGAIGKVFYVHVVWAAYYDRPPSKSNIVFDLAPHPVDILNLLLDEWPITIDAVGHSYKFKGSKEEDMAFITLGFPDNVLSDIYVSWIHHGKKERSFEIVGEKATIFCDALNQNVVLYTESGEKKIDVEKNNTMQDIQSDFINSVKKRSPQLNSAMVGAATVQVLEGINAAMLDWKGRGHNRTGRGLEDKELQAGASRFSVITDAEIGEGTIVRDHVNLYKCKIGKNCKIESFVYIEEGVKVGDNCKIKPNVYIPTGVTIGDNVFIGPSVTFTNDKYPKSSGKWKLEKTIIDDGASIGAHSVILPGLRIGKNSLVGAGAVVTDDVPDNAIVYGNPARAARPKKK